MVKKKNAEILSSEKEKIKLYFSKEKGFSIVFNYPERKILIINLRNDSIDYDFLNECRESKDEELE